MYLNDALKLTITSAPPLLLTVANLFIRQNLRVIVPQSLGQHRPLSGCYHLAYVGYVNSNYLNHYLRPTTQDRL